MKEDIERVIGYGANAVMYSTDKKQDFISVYKSVFGVDTCGNCPGEIYNKFLQLKNIDKENIKVMTETAKDTRKYKLKKNIVLDTHFGDGVKVPMGHWTNANITDAIAEKLIKAGFGKFFEDLDGETPEDADGDGQIDLSAKELKEIAVQNGIPAEDVKNMKKPAILELLKSKGIELKKAE